jgi:hypothetical protein
MADEGRRIDIAVCEKHGLRYNRATESGCVRCRRESGVVALPPAAGSQPTATARPAGAAAPPRSEQPASAGTQLLIALLLVGGTGGIFYGAQQSVLAGFAGGTLATVGQEGAEAAAAPGQRKSFETVDPTDPAAWETPAIDPRGHGPDEEQKQLHDFFQQMKEEEARSQQGPDPAEPAPQ